MTYLSPQAPPGWHPRPGELIRGRAAGRTYQGIYEGAQGMRTGAVLARIRQDTGRTILVHTIEPAVPFALVLP